MSKGNKYRILSLDGGGSWAIIQVRTLQDLYGEKTNGRDVLAKFDLVIANSGGSLAMAAMANGLRLDEIIDIYHSEKKRKLVFSPLRFGERTPAEAILSRLAGIGPKYSAERKREGLEELLPNLVNVWMHDLPKVANCPDTHFIICNFDYDNNRAAFQRSNAMSRGSSSMLKKNPQPSNANVLVLDAIHGASNAPINYFDEPAKYNYQFDNFGKTKRWFWDGAVGGYNNPVAAGVTEALINGIPAEKIRVLSIGTGSTMRPVKRSDDDKIPVETSHECLLEVRPDHGLMQDIKVVSGSILADPPDAASFDAFVLMNPALDLKKKTNLVRMNPMVQPIWNPDVLPSGEWQFPPAIKPADAEKFEKLAMMDMDAVEDWQVNLIDGLALDWIKNRFRNQTIRKDEHFNALIGHDWYSEAKNEWLAIS